MQIQRTQDFGNFYPRYCRKIKLKFNKTQHRSLKAALCFWIYWKIFLWLRTYKNDTIILLHLWDTFVVEHKKEEKEKMLRKYADELPDNWQVKLATWRREKGYHSLTNTRAKAFVAHICALD